MSIKIAFELQLASTDTGCLVPMNLRDVHRAIVQFYSSDSLPFSPPCTSVTPTQTADLANRGTHSDRLDVGEVTQNPEMHRLRVPAVGSNVKRRLTVGA
jgi:hypothetical protein